MKPERFISIDIETDGPFYPRYSVCSIGAVACDDLTKRFYVEIKPQTAEYDEQAYQVNGLHRDKLITDGQRIEAAVFNFVGWAQTEARYDSEGRRCHLIATTFSTWDWTWLWSLLNLYGRSASDLPFAHSSLDLKSYAMGRLGGFARWDETRKAALPPHWLAGLPPHTHNALDDAIEQATLFNHMRDVYKWTYENGRSRIVPAFREED